MEILTTRDRAFLALKFFCVLSLCAWLPSSVRCAEPAEPAPLPPMREIRAGVYQIGKMQLDKNANTLTFPAALQMESGFLEYLLVAPYGSTHESLLVTEIQPSDLHFAMLLLGAKGAGILTPGPDAKPPAQIDDEYLKRAPPLQGDPVTIRVIWQRNGKEETARVESWILDKQTNKPATNGPWMYSGSMFSSGKFMAQIEGSLASVVTNPSALINNPRPGHDNDEAWAVNESAVPPRETAVQLQIKLEAGKKPQTSSKTK